MKKKKSSNELSPDQKQFVRKVVTDPVLFADHFLGIKLWEREAEILRSIARNRRTAVKACHGVGKTFTLAIATLWWLARWVEGVVLTTSPTMRQVETQLWSEIHRVIEHARVPYPTVNKSNFKFRGDDNFAIGFSTNRATHFQGYHGKHVLILADEAPGIESGIWDAVAGTMAGGIVHIVMAGNPTIPSGPFFDAFSKERGLWNCFTIDVFDSPNLTGLSLEQVLSLDPSEGGPLDQNPIPYLVTKRWVRDQYLAWWHGDESSSPNWLSRVLARFPDQSPNALFKLDWLERAGREALQTTDAVSRSGPLVAGVDVGGGESETVVYVCECKHDRSRIIKMGAFRGEDTRGQVVKLLSEFRRDLSSVRVDSIGVGYNFALALRDERFPVEMINVAMACESQPTWDENDPSRRFVNLKAHMYQTVADAFERGQVEGLTDEMTIGQLAGIFTEFDARGRIKIESKEDARKRGVTSPDRAEALMLALGRPPTVWAHYNIKDLRRLARQSPERPHGDDAYRHTGFREVPWVDDEDDIQPVRRWSKRFRGF